MKDANKIVPSDEIRDWYSKLGAKGGSASSEKKTAACKLNARRPCHPGRKKGRPPGSKNKKK